VSSISDLHSRSLNNTDEALSQQNATALDQLVAETRNLSNQIKAQIQELEKESVPAGQDARIRKNQARRTILKSVNRHSLKLVTADVPRPFEIRRGFAELSTGRATVSHAIPSAG
jgi:t-SNARE complex subunit (syntaxin)